MNGALGAEYPYLVVWRESCDGAEAHPGDRAGRELYQDLDVVWDCYISQPAVPVFAMRDVDSANGGDCSSGAEPAHYRLVPDPHLHDVVAGQVSAVTPVEFGVPVHEPALVYGYVRGQHVAEIAVRDEVFDRIVYLERVRRGDDLSYQVGLE